MYDGHPDPSIAENEGSLLATSESIAALECDAETRASRATPTAFHVASVLRFLTDNGPVVKPSRKRNDGSETKRKTMMALAVLLCFV